MNNPKDIFVSTQFIVLFQIIVNIVILLDIPNLRQILGFIYLTFIPGFAIVKAFRLDQKDILWTFLLSVGINFALLLFVGLLLNEILPIFGYQLPLSIVPLLITFNLIVFCSCLLIYYKGINVINTYEYSYKNLILLTIIPLLSIIGTIFVNNINNNSILLIMLIIIATFYLLGSIYKKILPPNIYPLAIFAITFALVFHIALITNYLIGWDFHSEYHAFELVNNKSFWDITFTSSDQNILKGYSMLSVTILPTIYSKIANIDGTMLFKILYPLVLTFIPMILYKFYSERMKDKEAYIAVLFLISNLAFFGIEGFSGKQIIGEFFYLLIFLVIFKEGLEPFKKWFFFITFSIALVLSYYALSYILLIFMFLPFLFISELSFLNVKNKHINVNMFLVFFILTFGWYIYSTASSQFNDFMNLLENLSTNFMKDFWDPLARSSTVLRALDFGQSSSLLHKIGKLFFYIANLFILIGFVKSAKIIFSNKKGDEHLDTDKEYIILSFLSLILLFLNIIIPNFARFFRAERFYQTSLLFLAPFFVSGGNTFFHYLTMRKKQVYTLNLLLIILIPFFLFETGFIYEVTGDSNYSLPLSMYRMDTSTLYNRITDAKDVKAASWLSRRMNYSNGLVYGDFISTLKILTSYGMLSAENFRELSNTTKFTGKINYIYFTEVNTLENKIIGSSRSWNSTDILPLIKNSDNIYSNGASKIFFLGDG